MIGLPTLSVLAFADGGTVLVHARVYGTSMSDATIVISGANIESIVENGAIPLDSKVFDVAGGTVYPGFVDGYTTNFSNLPAEAASTPAPDTASTAPASMWLGNRKGMRPGVKAGEIVDWDNVNKTYPGLGVVFAQVAPGGGSLRGQTSLIQPGAGKKVVIPGVSLELAYRGGGGGGGGRGGGYPGSLMGIISTLRQTFYDAAQASDLQVLKDAMSQKISTTFAASSEVDIDRAMGFANEFGLKLVIAGGRDAYKRASVLKQANIPVLASIAIGDEPAKTGTDADGPPDAVRAERAEVWKQRANNVKTLMAAGVRVVFCSDGDPMSDYLANVRKLIGLGLPKDSAVKALTDAEFFGQSNKIAEGSPANLTVMSGDIAESSSKVKFVVASGALQEVK